MAINPDTRDSLILRLGDPVDELAWAEFLEIYQPMLLQLARRWGLQDSDASEIVQETLIAVSKSVGRFEREHEGAFRGWLATIARRRLADHLSSRGFRQRGSGDSDVHQWLDQQASPCSSESVWDFEQKQQVYRWAAKRVQSQVQPRTWDAFHMTAVEGQSTQDVAKTLGWREGMVYVARSRVMSRLRKEVQAWIGTESESSAPTTDSRSDS